MSGSSLQAEHPWRVDIPLLIGASALTLYFGLTEPVVRIASALYQDSNYSVIGGFVAFWRSGDYLIGLLILLFSAVFPVIKLCAMSWLWFAPTVRQRRRRNLRIIEPLGKWSMLDVLVVILFAGAVKLGLIADATVLGGAYVYGAAILMSMVAAVLMGAIAGPEPRLTDHPRSRSWLLPVLALAGFLLLLAGIFLPLMSVEKWLFWKEDFSILTGALKLAAEREFILSVGFILFVILLPALLQLIQVVLAFGHLTGQGGGRGVAWLIEFDRWAMTDVFALALFVAVVRLANWTTVTPRPGLYCFIGAIIVSPVVSFWLRRIYRPASSGDSRRRRR